MTIFKSLFTHLPTAEEASENIIIQTLLLNCFSITGVSVEAEIKKHLDNKKKIIYALDTYYASLLNGHNNIKGLALLRELLLVEDMAYLKQVHTYRANIFGGLLSSPVKMPHHPTDKPTL